MEDQTVKEKVKSSPLPIGEAQNIQAQVTKALEDAHELIDKDLGFELCQMDGIDTIVRVVSSKP